jgi:hypothetical protein
MGILKRAWDLSGWILGGYTVYKQLQGLREAKNDFYQSLSSSQKSEWDKIFGAPGTVQIVTPFIPPVQIRSTVPQPAPTMTQLQAGT